MITTDTAHKQADFQPLFMFGFERSGTTLLSIMVGAHPEIAVPLSTAGMWYSLHQQVQPCRDVNRGYLIDSLLSHERIKLWDVEYARSEILDRLKTTEWSDCISTFHGYYAERKKKPYWASMDISHMNHLGLLNQWFPNARFLHIIRDPRDVALSFKGYRYGSTNILEVTQKWISAIECSLREGEILGKSRYRIIRYEDLILQPEQTLRDICAFIGVTYSPQMLEYGAMVDEKVPKDKRDLWPALSQKPQEDKVGRWRKELSRANCAIIEDYAKDQMATLGYPLTTPRKRPINSFLLELWYFINRGNRIQRRFGPRRK